MSFGSYRIAEIKYNMQSMAVDLIVNEILFWIVNEILV